MTLGRDELETMLWSSATDRAAEQGYRLGDGASDQIRYVAHKTAAEITTGSQDDERVRAEADRAVAAFQTLVDTMIEVRGVAYAADAARLNSDVIGEETLHHARLKLCPGFWPFC